MYSTVPFNPVSTYRLQFNREFTLQDAGKIIPYLHQLGIRTMYASPLLRAVSGSAHGYDVTDPLSLNPEIGTGDGFKKLVRRLRKKEMGWLQDFVPNHMAFSTENPWMTDVLIHGKDSEFYRFFDIVTDHPDPVPGDKLMVPFFGKPADELLRDRELKLVFGERGFLLAYYEDHYPVSRQAYSFILKEGAITRLQDLVAGAVSHEKWADRVGQLYHEYRSDRETSAFVDRCLDEINSKPELMEQLVERLTWLPVHWKETEKRINYRRFFTINGLISLNMQSDRVFEMLHTLVGSWISGGLIDGLRVDHIDGLYDPSGYLEKLRKFCGEKAYLVVEKILDKGEKIPSSWPVQGTTGYDFLALVNNLLTRSSNGRFFHDFYNEWTGAPPQEPAQVFLEKKRFILHNHLAGDLDLLTHEFATAGFFGEERADRDAIRMAIAEFMVHCQVYKYYRVPSAFGKKERKGIREIFRAAARSGRAGKQALYLLEEVFLPEDGNTGNAQRADRFFRRLMQFTGPLMAKGLEDTAYYTFNPFIAHNEVGDSPGYFGIDTTDFHRFMKKRQEESPLTMNTLSTHDTKRGEDARARLNVLSDLPVHWKTAALEWRKMNREYKTITKDGEIPSPADEYLLYQALCAHLPMDGKTDAAFLERLEAYLVKALREGKEHSSWSEPDQEYEQATNSFCRAILAPGSMFPESLNRFMEQVIPHGIINSVSQVILRNTLPGVPDIYQGSENWNFSFVDPDNRRPVDYRKLSADLDRMIRNFSTDREGALDKLWKGRRNGLFKQWASCLTLRERVKDPELFLKGDYIPLKVRGTWKEHLVAYCRSYRDRHLVVVLPLNTASLPGNHEWEDTAVKLPPQLPILWEDLFTGNFHERNGTIPASVLLSEIPFAVLKAIPNRPEKRAGILLHLSSLPGEFGAGDFGPGAYRFVDFLHLAGQRYWQILPLNTISSRTWYSPYSSRSAFAASTLFIDPRQLEKAGLLDPGEAGRLRLPWSSRADYIGAERVRKILVDLACRKFFQGGTHPLGEKYRSFLEKEEYWIHDYALFEVLKEEYSSAPWNEWPPEYRDRDPETLEAFRREHREEIEKVYFGQFICSEQWGRLRQYARDRGVDIFGDLPIYIDHDSADAWAHPRLFRLQANRSMDAVAGVPPDYFNSEGQLWGMPLYDWENMEADGYRWWIHRIGRNLQWYDLLRLDHFRAFSAYWEVPAEEDTSINGKWTRGPGTGLFDTIREHFPEMPFVAEDLGEIDQPVYDLRDRYSMPGMKVLQFGFGNHMAFSHHNPGNIPYHCILYTGTHDNNTLAGWFRYEADKQVKKNYRNWTGKSLKREKVHMEMIRLAFSLPARLVIIPMQDWLGLDGKSRMNHPSTTGGNWLWRVDPGMLKKKLARKMRKMVVLFGRF